MEKLYGFTWNGKGSEMADEKPVLTSAEKARRIVPDGASPEAIAMQGKISDRIEANRLRSEAKLTQYQSFLVEVEKLYEPQSSGWLCAVLEYQVRFSKRDRDKREAIKLLGETKAMWKKHIVEEKIRTPEEVQAEFEKRLRPVFDNLGKRRAEVMGGAGN